MDIRFEGRVIVVTGGATGIGQAAARTFAAGGGRVIITGIEPAREVDVKTTGAEEYRRLDVRSEGDVQRFAAYVEEAYGGADVLCNNAGVLFPHPAHECTAAEWEQTMAVNATGVFLCSKYFLPHMMRKGGGAVVNTCSMSGLFADDAYFAYCASKGAVANMTRSMAVDYARYNIRVNAVNPGSTCTPMHLRMCEAPGLGLVEYGHKDVYPLERIAQPQEVANCIVFLASAEASFVTGHNLLVDGGLTAHTGSQRRWGRIAREYEAATATKER